MPMLSYIVLLSKDQHETVYFYELLLGTQFRKEKHNSGPEHYSCNLENILLEIYPTKKDAQCGSILGFPVEDLDGRLTALGIKGVRVLHTETCKYAVVKDPDGRKVHLVEKNGACNVKKHP